MNSVISATTGAAYGTAITVSRQEGFLDAARELLSDALEQECAGHFDVALESAYRAALRTAGAQVAASPAVGKRKRLPSSAWDKLKLTGERGAYWSSVFSSYSRMRGRVASGIDLQPSPVRVRELIRDAEKFFAEVSGESTGLAAA